MTTSCRDNIKGRRRGYERGNSGSEALEWGWWWLRW